MKKCLHCGHINGDEMEICENCYEKLEEEIKENNLANKNSGTKKPNLCVFVLSVVCASLFIILVSVIIIGFSSNRETFARKNLEIQKLEDKVESIQEEYDTYRESMEKYEDIIPYADSIEGLKQELEELEQEKEEKEAIVSELNKEIELAQNPKSSSDNLVYSDDKVEIYFDGITRDGVVFEVKNMTDINLTFQADSIAINGISTNDIIMSDDVAQQSVGKIIAGCSEFLGTENVYSVSGQLTVIDFSSHNLDSYKAKFTNVEIK